MTNSSPRLYGLGNVCGQAIYNGRFNRGRVVLRMMESETMTMMWMTGWRERDGVIVKSKETVNMREDDTPDGPMWKTKILNNS